MPDLSSTFLHVPLSIWLTGGAIVFLVALAHIALRWWARARARAQEKRPLVTGESPKVRTWVARGLSEAVPPIAFLLWLHGLSVAAAMLLGELPDNRWSALGHTVLGALRGAGTVLGLAWLLARIARTLAALLQSFATRTEAG